MKIMSLNILTKITQQKEGWLYNYAYDDRAQPSECGRQRTLNTVYGHTAARLQSN